MDGEPHFQKIVKHNGESANFNPQKIEQAPYSHYLN